MSMENMAQERLGASIQLTGDGDDLSIYICNYCGMRHAKDDVPLMARGKEQDVVFKPIPFCADCRKDIIAVNGIKKRMDLPTSIGSIVGGM